MDIIQKVIKVDKYNYYIKHLEFINVLLPLEKKMSGKEIEVLAAFMYQDKNLIQEDMFNSITRKKAMAKLNNMSPGGLGNHLKSLVEKGFLTKNDITKKITFVDKYVKAFTPSDNNQGYKFKILIKKEDEVK